MIFIHFSRSFALVTDLLAFEDAMSYCQNIGGRLAETRNQEQYDVVEDLSRSLGATNFWLGACDGYPEGHWYWISDRSPVALGKFWLTNQPDNAGGNENCLQIQHGQGLDDFVCATKQKFICEFGDKGDVRVCDPPVHV